MAKELIGIYAKKIEAEYGEEFVTMLFAERIKLILAELIVVVQGQINRATPATVEKFIAYQFTEQSTGQTFYDTWKRKPIGEVVAYRLNDAGDWDIRGFPNNIPIRLPNNEYRALVEHNVTSGIWESTNA